MPKKHFFRNPKNTIIVGTFLFILSLFLSFYAMYYSSPRFEYIKKFSLPLAEDSANEVRIEFPKGIGERIYYSINLTSSHDLQIKLYFLDNDGRIMSESILEKGDGSFRKRGSFLLDRSPLFLRIVFKGVPSDRVNGTMILRYSQVDISTLAILSVTSTITSLFGMGFLAFGVYGYLIEKEFERRSGRKKKIT